MIATFLLKNIEIVAAVISLGGMGIYLCLKEKSTEDEDNDLTYLIVEQKRIQKSIESQINTGFFNFKK